MVGNKLKHERTFRLNSIAVSWDKLRNYFSPCAAIPLFRLLFRFDWFRVFSFWRLPRSSYTKHLQFEFDLFYFVFFFFFNFLSIGTGCCWRWHWCYWLAVCRISFSIFSMTTQHKHNDQIDLGVSLEPPHHVPYAVMPPRQTISSSIIEFKSDEKLRN